MDRKNILLLLVILFTVPINAKINPPEAKQKIVVIDPGHGGKDSGAVGLHSKEKDIVLNISLKVGKYIEQNMPNVKVIYTRTTDVFPTLYERANVANKNNADLFISIHANSNSNTKAYGTDSFVMGLHKTKGNLEVAKKENSVIVLEENYNVTYEGFDPNSAESYIIFSLMQNAFLDQSLELASYIQYQFREKAKRKDRGVKQAGFLVLWNTTMPSVLIETGFISNPEEEKYLMSDQGQSYIASAIYRAVKKYFNNYDDDEDIVSTSKQTNSENIAQNSNDNKLTEPTSTSAPEDINKVVFRIQVLSSSRKLNRDTDLYNNYTDIYEYQENNLFKYAVGNYKNLVDAKEMQKEIKEGYPGAFIIAFRNGNKISLAEALK